MKVYHGSKYKFAKLEIYPELSGESTLNNEGPGIYVSTNSSVAKSYGKYIYSIESPMVDFRVKKNIDAFVHRLMLISRERASMLNTDSKDKMHMNKSLNKLQIQLDTLTYNLYHGSQAFAGLQREIMLLLDSYEETYNVLTIQPDLFINTVASAWGEYLPKAYMFNYNIPNVGVIKDPSTSVIKNIRVIN